MLQRSKWVQSVAFLITSLGILAQLYAEPSRGKLESRDIRENIYHSAMVSGQTVFMVGDRGRIFRSQDGGKTWERIKSGTRLPLFSVSFGDDGHGWISGKSGLILHSNDGGLTWAPQESGLKKHLFSIAFTDERNGCAVGDWGAIVVTDNGGKTWRDASLRCDVVLYGVAFADSENGWSVGEFGQVFRTRDRGRTWEGVYMGDMEERSLFSICIRADAIYAAGLDGRIIYSWDRGQTWRHGANPSTKSLYDIEVIGLDGWAVGDAGTVLRTSDAGCSWEVVPVPEKTKLHWLGALSLKKGSPGQFRGFGSGAHGLFFKIKECNLLW